MAELEQASDCCSAAARAECCEPAEQDACCTGEGACGCDARQAEAAVVWEQVRERYAAAAHTHRVHEHAGAAIIRAAKSQ